VRGQGVADLVDVGAVDANGLVEHLAGDVELFGPVGDVGGDLGVDLFGVARAFGVVLVCGVGLAGLGLLDFFVFVRAGWVRVRHAWFPLSVGSY
jgi:hypothetical protein